MKALPTIKLIDKITLFSNQRTSDIIIGLKSPDTLNNDLSRFIMVQFERIRQHCEKFQMGDLEELQMQFLQEYQDTFISTYNSYLKFSK